ncbi:MAG: hypothetical protein ABI395_01340 [Sphingobium sp.]
MPIKRAFSRGFTGRAFFITALTLMGTAMAASAPVAAKEDISALSASPKFREAIARVKASLDAGDTATATGTLATLQPSSPIEKYMVASLRLDLAVRQNDARAQRSAITDILGSGAVPTGQEAYLHYLSGYMAMQGGAFDDAIGQFSSARTQGYDKPQLSLMLVDAYVRRGRQGDALKLLSETIDKQVAGGQSVPAAWFDRAAALAYGQKDWSLFARFQARKLLTYSTPADWRTAIITYIAGANPDNEAQIDLLRLQYATSALASERDYQGYAKLAESMNYPAEAKSVIEAGRSSGDLLVKDAVTAPMFAKLGPKAKQYLAATTAGAGKSGSAKSSPAQAAATNGDKLLSVAKYSEAVSAYRSALAATDGVIERDRVNTRLGIALARSGDMPGAQAAFALAGGKWADIATLWSAWASAPKRQ